MIAPWRTNKLNWHIFILQSQMQQFWVLRGWGECQPCPPQMVSPVSTVGGRWLGWMDHCWGGLGYFTDCSESTQECHGFFFYFGILSFTVLWELLHWFWLSFWVTVHIALIQLCSRWNHRLSWVGQNSQGSSNSTPGLSSPTGGPPPESHHVHLSPAVLQTRD